MKMKIRYKKVPKFEFVWLPSLGSGVLLLAVCSVSVSIFQSLFFGGPRGSVWELINLKPDCSLFSSFPFAMGTLS